MIYHPMALAAAAGDDNALKWLAQHAVREDGRHTIIACDFDGTLCESNYPDIIAPNAPLLTAVRLMQGMGYEFILWTCRECDVLDEALAWLAEQGVHMKANDNSEAVIRMFGGYNSRKLFADEYWDDKAANAAIHAEDTL